MLKEFAEMRRFGGEKGKKAKIVQYAQPAPESRQPGDKRNWRERRIVNNFVPNISPNSVVQGLQQTKKPPKNVRITVPCVSYCRWVSRGILVGGMSGLLYPVRLIAGGCHVEYKCVECADYCTLCVLLPVGVAWNTSAWNTSYD